MKKVLLMVLSTCLLIGLFAIGASAASDNYGKSYSAPYGVPTIDGVVDPIWSLAEWEYINVNSASNKISARFKVLHDDYLIYFLVEAEDPAMSEAQNESIHLRMHSHTCSDLDTCTEFTTDLMTIKGKIWSVDNSAEADNSNYKLLKTQSQNGVTYTMEWAFSPANAIPKNSSTPFQIDFLADDYMADNTWISNPQTWNAYNSTSAIVNVPGNFGNLYFKTASETASLGAVTFYNDVPETHAAYNAIVYTSSQGVFVPASSANPSFYPDMNLTRAQFVTALGRLAGVNVASYTTTSFTDVNFARDKWFAGYAEWAKEVGLVVGSQFMANKTITVSEAVVMLQRYAEHVDNKYAATVATLAYYTDTATVPSWAKAAMQWAVKNGVYVPTGTTLNPTAPVNRAMTAQLIYNYETVLTSGNVDEKPGVSLKEPPSNIDWEKEFAINALEFGFVNDGKTFNDGIMAYYIEHYSDRIPIVFPAGQYAFQYSIDFPSRVYVELAPRAEWILMSDTVIDCFVSLQKQNPEANDGFESYSQQSYIRGGIINANYKAKVGLGLHGGFHTHFADFRIQNVLEIGIKAEIVEEPIYGGNYSFENLYMYNEEGLLGTIAYYDNQADDIYSQCHALNFETGYYTRGGKFLNCSAWISDRDIIPTSVYAYVTGGAQLVFDNPIIDTYRTGFKVMGTTDPGISITNLVWITNNLFYTCGQFEGGSNLQRDYPMVIFDVEDPDAYIHVVNMYLPWREWGFAFSNQQLPNSSFINVRWETGWDPWNHMANFRNDLTRLKAGKDYYDWSDMPSHDAWHK